MLRVESSMLKVENLKLMLNLKLETQNSKPETRN